MGYTKEQLLAHLQELNIDFVSYNHPVVLTVEAQAKYVGHLGGGLSKNLLLKDKKHRFYIVSALAGTKVDLKVLSQRLGLGKGGLRMAPEEALQELLQVPLGCVTPFALINESARTVSLLLDQGFRAKECCFFHPLSNDMTISLSSQDLDKFLISIGRQPPYVDLEATPLVGKDQPPDLATLVPSGVPVLPNPAEKEILSQHPGDNHDPIEIMSTELTGKAVCQSKNSQGTLEKPKVDSDPLAAVTDVRKFVEEIIKKSSEVVLSEIQHEEQQRPGARKRLIADIENLTTMFKNAAYTQGFCAGVKSMPTNRCPPPAKF